MLKTERINPLTKKVQYDAHKSMFQGTKRKSALTTNSLIKDSAGSIGWFFQGTRVDGRVPAFR